MAHDEEDLDVTFDPFWVGEVHGSAYQTFLCSFERGLDPMTTHELIRTENQNTGLMLCWCFIQVQLVSTFSAGCHSVMDISS